VILLDTSGLLGAIDAADMAEARRLLDGYRDLDLGLRDACALCGPSGRPFRLLPADACPTVFGV